MFVKAKTNKVKYKKLKKKNQTITATAGNNNYLPKTAGVTVTVKVK